MRHPAQCALGPPHPDPPARTTHAHPALVARPQPHRLAAARAAQSRDLDALAGCRVLLDAQRARPYDGHGVLTPPGPSRSANSHGRVLRLFTDSCILASPTSPSQISSADLLIYVLSQSRR